MNIRLLVSVAGAALFASLAHAAPSGGATALTASANPHTVVVELFTSEGCSSCPPADTVLRKLAGELGDGAQIIALGEHVDYWNQLGWRDPYSSAQFSTRQGDYARALHLDQVYTPQMIVEGKAEFVGSDEKRARVEIDRARSGQRPFLPLRLTVRSLGAHALQLLVDAPATAANSGDYEVIYAVTEDGLSSDVAHGENAGRRLTHAAVVRHMGRLGAYGPVGQSGLSRIITIGAAEAKAALHVVAFVQHVGTGEIASAAEVNLKDLGTEVSTR